MISVKEKVGYGLGDAASAIIFQTVMLFLAYFYTDIYGLPPAIIGTLFLVVRVFDAITDPLMGAITDRTQTRWGKFRPYLLWLAIPFTLTSVITFTTPDFDEQGKIYYAFATYALLMVMYTAINIPYCALGGVITSDPQERVSVQTYRFVLAMAGGLVVASLTLPMVDYFGNGDKAVGYQYTMIVMSTFGLLMFFICFFTTRERIFPPKEQNTKLLEDIKVLWINDQWRILCMVTFFLLITIVSRNTLAIYYVNHFIGRADLATVFITTGMVGNLLGCACAQILAQKVDKVRAYIWLQIISSTVCAGSFFINGNQVLLAFCAYFLWCFFLQMATPLLWSKMADTVDYGQWKTNIRITGLVYSSNLFFLKLGVAVGGAMSLWLLAYYEYDADAVASVTTQQGIALSFTLVPATFSLIVAFIMRFYILDNQKLAHIQQDLRVRILNC